MSDSKLRNNLRVIIIGNPARGGLKAQIPEFEQSVSVTVVPSVVVNELHSLPSDYSDLKRYQVFAGKIPMAGEVGCAAAHVNACKRLIDCDANWALVLEDDAEVAIPIALLSRSQEIIHQHSSNSPIIVSFYTRDVRPEGWGPQLISGVYFLPVAISFTVCYLMNRSAAQLILSNQTPIQSSADWPVTPPDLDFAIDTGSFVDHLDDDQRLSSIGPLETRIGARLTRMQIWAGIWYLRHRKIYGTFDQFQQKTFKKRLYYHAFVLPQVGRRSSMQDVGMKLSALLWRHFYGAPSDLRVGAKRTEKDG